MSNKRNRRNLLWITCFCAESRAAVLEEADEKLVRLIQKGNLPIIERALRRLRRPLNEVTLVVKRRHLSTAYPCLVDHRAAGSDPFINFYQECSPVLWAVDCLQWQVLPLLGHHGYDINRPQTCRRWTHICGPSSRPNSAPYRRFWTCGRYTYQSALDYFFASIYEFLGEQPSTYNGLSGPSPLAFYFSHLPAILTKGVDVHRIDSVIIFNSLAASYDEFLCRYTNEYAIVPDIPENDDAFVEMTAVKHLVENGFSQFECMDYLYPCCNWFGILLCLICHPKIDSYGTNLLPPIIRHAALLLTNLLLLKCTFPSAEEFSEALENLHLRKVYSKRYCERRDEFNRRLSNLHQVCQSMVLQPLSLKILARNAVRKQLGGVDFCRKLASLCLPPQLHSFVQYINQEHLKAIEMPKQLIRLAQGEWVEYSLDRRRSDREDQSDSCWHHSTPSTNNHQTNSSVEDFIQVDVERPHRDSSRHPVPEGCEFENSFISPPWPRLLRRGRTSERQHLAATRRLALNHQYSGNTRNIRVRPSSAPVLSSSVFSDYYS
ncbi:hypothetical protein T265_03026 [Opisthorchis viverrini]|uniref:SOCS box domain-containing protein n=1 Tax=Opisthorchis viverrini TaxID=6198 RepID=A0A074ZX86_OPIVI|nr:hypothetical protein T265_03026 [Opisthorchis viverrini]KER30542.1 hypothetical protein T265_03026 [Opisthorchis viverrini]